MLHVAAHPVIGIQCIPVSNQIAGSDIRFRITWVDFVGREHLSDHLVVTRIGVEGLDDPIAPAPNLWSAVPNVGYIPSAEPVCIPPNIHPVPSPAFCVHGRSEQFIDDLFVIFLGRISREIGEGLWARWQPDKVEVDSPQSGIRIGLGLPNETFGFPGLLQERIDRMDRSVRGLEVGDFGSNRDLKSPMLIGIRFRGIDQGNMCTLFDPSEDGLNLRFGKRVAFGGHPNLGILSEDSSNKDA